MLMYRVIKKQTTFTHLPHACVLQTYTPSAPLPRDKELSLHLFPCI